MTCIGISIADLSTSDTLDVYSIADVTNAEGILSNGPVKGDLIALDWLPGADFQIGPRGPHSFDLPLVMKGGTEVQRLANLRRFQALEGHRVRITRTITAPVGPPVVEACEGVVVNAVAPQWDLRERGWVRCTLVTQVLVPWSVSPAMADAADAGSVAPVA